MPTSVATEDAVLGRFAAAVIGERGKYRKPKRFGQAVAVIAQLYGLLRLEQSDVADLVSPAELQNLQRELARLLEPGELARLESLVAALKVDHKHE